ncbi:MAG: hypothetical protein WBK43_10795 [Prolixibacteraceae bacterium]|jgi:hypothetical protein|nr:hypothetical protein [Prolixibacteraceae bacterium]MDI9564685.1 hypothetical protein [Bacteroidota bacterium]NLS98709.1 hypothetical protein [Bacteroidales bacterium]OQB81957.1 MAG: hypothetical protein BWX87_00257 [Bacteroidetes bacterium ADurb.Bin123]HNU77585.1 hypothetical protein [Prolixibacteraceae bacterium]
MDIWLDDRESEILFRHLLRAIEKHRSWEVAERMKQHGILYKMNWGVPLTSLREMAADVAPSHILSFKLWNRQWRETMILATLVDDAALVTEQQMDFWTRSMENSEIAEQASANLWCRTPFAYVKMLEWCRGKKHWVRFSAIHLGGRLALTDNKSPDEIFDPFLEEIIPLARDGALSEVIARTLLLLANRSPYLRNMVVDLVKELRASGHPTAISLAVEIEEAVKYLE